MEANSNRVAQVFIWKQGAAPDLNYARKVLSVANPVAYRAVMEENAPLQLLSVIGPWPENPWARALNDLRALPAPGGISWADPNYYDLVGWQGSDSHTGNRLFIAAAYSKIPAWQQDSITGTGVQAPQYAPAAPGYYTQYPTGPLVTGPLMWPPQPGAAPYAYPPPYPQPAALGSYPYGYNPLMTGPLPAAPGMQQMVPQQPQPQPQVEMVQPAPPDSYVPFYAGFGRRLAASLIDFFFMMWFQLIGGAIPGLIWASYQPQPARGDLEGWLGLYGPFLALAVLIFVAYHVTGWTVSGRTFGKKLMGIRVVRADGNAPGFGHAILRMLGYFFSAAIAGTGFLMIIVDARRQGLHDKLAETYVIPEVPEVAPPDGLPGYKASTTNTTTGPLARILAEPTTGSAPSAVRPQSYSVLQTSPLVPQRAPEPAPQPQSQTTTGQLRTPAQASADETGKRIPSTRADQPAWDRAEEVEQDTEEEQPVVEPAQEKADMELPSNERRARTDTMRAATTSEQALESLQPRTREPVESLSNVEKARALYKSGMAELEKGSRKGHTGMEVDTEAARSAADKFKEAIQLVPEAVVYRYYYAAALRYAEGFEIAIDEFRQVLELDAGHYEARQQVAFGPRWHDAFAYPAWGDPAPAGTNMILPEPVRTLLSQPQRPGTRLVLLREGGSKMVVALSRTRRDTWSSTPTADMPARIELVITRTPSGPIIAFYAVVRDNPENPYKGETFLNPHDPGQPSDDACQLGQYMLAQLARQDHTYLIFVDENDQLLLSRKLVFDAATQVNIARVLYEVQNLPPQIMEPARFQQAAQWHMEHFSLDQIKP